MHHCKHIFFDLPPAWLAVVLCGYYYENKLLGSEVYRICQVAGFDTEGLNS